MSTNTETTDKDDATDQNNDSDTDLTAFQTNILFVVRGCHEGRYDGQAENGAYGLAIKHILERDEWYGEEINHGRLYPNLDQLVDKGLLEKGELDKRTNYYALTEEGTQLIAKALQRYIGSFKGEPTNGGSA